MVCAWNITTNVREMKSDLFCYFSKPGDASIFKPHILKSSKSGIHALVPSTLLSSHLFFLYINPWILTIVVKLITTP